MTDIRRAIEAEFGDFPLAALIDRRTRGVFKAWRLGRTTKRSASPFRPACSPLPTR